MDEIDNHQGADGEPIKRKGKRKYGRKKLNESEAASAQLKIRLTVSDKKLLSDRAKKARLSITDYCKERLFSQEPLYSINIQDMHKAYKLIADQINPIGNNINQLVKLANVSAKHGTVDQKTFKDFNQMMGQFLEQHKKVIDLNLTIIHSKK